MWSLWKCVFEIPISYLGCVLQLKFLPVTLNEFCDAIFKQAKTVSLSVYKEYGPTLEINRCAGV
jgi:hypothetical protein